jgi:hypothetical protein
VEDLQRLLERLGLGLHRSVAQQLCASVAVSRPGRLCGDCLRRSAWCMTLSSALMAPSPACVLV